MKAIGYSLFLSLIIFTTSACDSEPNNQAINQSQVSMLNEQFSTLENDLLLMRKEVADAPELETDLDKLAAMTVEDRMAIEDVRINYTVKKNVLAHQLMGMVEEIEIQKSVADENKDSNLANDYDKLLNRIADLQAELGVEQSQPEHH